ncbi:hypothetical protein, partial [Pseudomonas aeruginosa]|uniref:hypothetical protein n=1 Tax=Pseudomonas aeruginosa TaxID=287 RepID=UPI0022CDCF3D
LSETPKGNLKWLAVTSTAGTPDRQAAAKPTFSTESAKSGHLVSAKSVAIHPLVRIRLRDPSQVRSCSDIRLHLSEPKSSKDLTQKNLSPTSLQ